MERIITIVAAALCLCAALPAGAQARQGGESANDVTEYTFPDEAVVGGLPGVDEAVVVVRPRAKSRSLIKVRTNFVPAMLKSIEDI